MCMCVCVCVCVSASLPPPPSGKSLTQNRPQSKKVKNNFSFPACPQSLIISTITSRKQSLGRSSLFPGPPWTTIYIYISRESSSDFAYETTPLPLPAPRTWSRCEYEVQHEKDQQRWVRKKKGRKKRKKRERKKDPKHCISLFFGNFVGVFFLVIFPFFNFIKIFVKKKHELNFPFYMIYRNCLFCNFPAPKST